MPDLSAFFPRGVSRVIFDLDGVLTDSTPCHRRAFADLWTELGIDGPPYEEVAGRSTWAVVEEVTAPLSPSEELIREWAARKQGRAIELLSTAEALFPDVLPVLDALRDLKVPMAVGTGASRRRTMDLLTGAGIRGYGNLVIVRHRRDLVTVYAHNRKNLVRRGDRVTRGQTIAEVGHTGRTSGSHLHFEVRRGEVPLDPLKHLVLP